MVHQTSNGPEGEYIHCEDKDCPAKFKNHLWGHIKAEGWLRLKDGRAYCPDHIPDWYASWKRRQTK